MSSRLGILIFCIVIASQLTGCDRLLGGSGASSITLARVTVKKISPELTFSTNLIPSESHDLKFPYDVQLEKVMVSAGDSVLAGDPILRRNMSAEQAQLRTLKAERQETLTKIDQSRFLLNNRSALIADGKMTELQASGVEQESQSLQATLARLEAQIAEVEQRLTQTLVESPIDGLVTQVNAGGGQEIGANQSILKIVRIDPILASFELGATDAGDLQVGDGIRVRIDELPGKEFDATIRFIGPELHLPGRTFVVWAAIDNPLGQLKIGMRGFAEFSSAQEHHAYFIPKSAIIMQNKKAHVFVVDKGVARLTRIHIEALHGKEAQVTGNIRAESLIVEKGPEGLQDGTIVDMR